VHKRAPGVSNLSSIDVKEESNIAHRRMSEIDSRNKRVTGNSLKRNELSLERSFLQEHNRFGNRKGRAAEV